MATVLEDFVLARYSAQFLLELCNPDDTQPQSTTTPVTNANTRLVAACDDVRGEWFDKVGASLNETSPIVSTNRGQLAAAATGVVAYLERRRSRAAGSGKAQEAWSLWQDSLWPYTVVAPITDSLLNPSRDNPGDQPAFDDQHFNDLDPNPPSGGSGFGTNDSLLDQNA